MQPAFLGIRSCPIKILGTIDRAIPSMESQLLSTRMGELSIEAFDFTKNNSDAERRNDGTFWNGRHKAKGRLPSTRNFQANWQGKKDTEHEEGRSLMNGETNIMSIFVSPEKCSSHYGGVLH